MKNMALYEAFVTALEADDAFSAALVRQFGRRTARWTARTELYDTVTKAAYEAKLAETAASQWLTTCTPMRQRAMLLSSA